MKNILIIIFTILLLSNCKKENTPENQYSNCPYWKDLVAMTDNSVKSSGNIPLSLTNYWIYSDSSWIDGVLQLLTQDTLHVISAEKTGEDIWWKMSDGYQLCNRNDTVYKMNFSGEVLPGTTVCPEKVLLFLSVPADTTVLWTEWTTDYGIPGEVKLNKSTIHTEAGNFSNFFEYTQSAAYRVNIRCIKPGIGIIKTIENNDYNKTRLVRTLIKYKIL